MLTSSMIDLCRSWDVVNTVLKLQLSSIRVLFQKSVVNIEHRYTTSFYFRLHDLFQDQKIGKKLERIKFVGYDKLVCGCFIIKTHGLLCVCELAGYQIQ